MNRPQPLWPDDRFGDSGGRDGWYGLTQERGSYFVSRNVIEDDPEALMNNRVAITEYIKASGRETVEILSTNLAEISAYPVPTTKESLDRLLVEISRRSKGQTSLTRLFEEDEAGLLPLARMAGVSTTDQVLALVSYLEKTGLVECSAGLSFCDAAPTIDGLIYLEELANNRRESTSCFVAMWFNEEMNTAYIEGIASAISECGFLPVRIDAKEHNNKIDDEIISEIKRARFLVADFSCGDDGARGGVYFEAGYAIALGIPVIFCVRESDLARVHFDTRQFSHIVWSSPTDLKQRLVNRISATITR